MVPSRSISLFPDECTRYFDFVEGVGWLGLTCVYRSATITLKDNEQEERASSGDLVRPPTPVTKHWYKETGGQSGWEG